jgi:hypothetical protein
VALAAALLALALAGCGVAAEPQVAPAGASFRSLAAGERLGQTLVARHNGLDAVELLLRPEAPGDGALRAELRDGPDGPALAAAALPLAAVTEPRLYRLSLGAPLESRGRDYFLQLAVAGAGSVQVAVAPAGAYLDGSLYAAGRPAEGQLVHALGFAPWQRAAGFARGLAAHLGLLLVALAAFVLPGLGLLAAADGPGRARPAGERAALAAGVGVALTPTLMVWAQLAGVRLGPWNAWLPVLLGVALLAWRGRRLRLRELWARRPRVDRLGAALLALLLLVALVRLVAADGLEAPLWGDAYQHTMMAQLMLDNGGLFDSWAPYVPYVTMTNQFGFPAVAAALGWAAGLGGVAATIAAGQLLNAAAALAVYPLALRVAGGRRWAGLAAVLAAGLLAPIPAYYVNWGRYAQLAGQVALPAAMVLTWDLLAARRARWPLAALLGLVVAGMCLAYYRMAFFYAAFVGALLLCWAVPTWGRDGRAWRGGLLRLAAAGAATAILFAPWALHVRSSNLAQTVQIATGLGAPLAYVQGDYAAWGLLPQFMPPWMLAVAAVGVVWAIVRRDWMLPGLFLWLVPPAAYMASSLFGVPGAILFQSFAVVIITYIPVAAAWGYLAAALAGLAARPRTPAALRWLLPGAILALALWGGYRQLGIVEPANVMVTRPDTRAMAWIRAETPPDARFLVHGFDVYSGTTAVGADAGWWLALLGLRANTMPPQYALANERPDPPDYTRRVVELVHTLKASPPASAAGMAALCAEGITHVYHGQGQGQVGTVAAPLFSPADLDASPHFALVYAADRVRIYAFDRAVCRP